MTGGGGGALQKKGPKYFLDLWHWSVASWGIAQSVAEIRRRQKKEVSEMRAGLSGSVASFVYGGVGK